MAFLDPSNSQQSISAEEARRRQILRSKIQAVQIEEQKQQGEMIEKSGNVQKRAGQATETAGSGVKIAGKTTEAAGTTTEIAGKGTEIAGKGIEATGKGVQAAGKGISAGGKALVGAGEALSSTVLGAVIGVPLAAIGIVGQGAGAVTTGAGKGVEATGKGVQATGKGINKAGKGIKKTGEGISKTGDQIKNTGNQLKKSGQLTQDLGKNIQGDANKQASRKSQFAQDRIKAIQGGGGLNILGQKNIKQGNLNLDMGKIRTPQEKSEENEEDIEEEGPQEEQTRLQSVMQQARISNLLTDVAGMQQMAAASAAQGRKDRSETMISDLIDKAAKGELISFFLWTNLKLFYGTWVRKGKDKFVPNVTWKNVLGMDIPVDQNGNFLKFCILFVDGLVVSNILITIAVWVIVIYLILNPCEAVKFLGIGWGAQTFCKAL